MDYSKWKEDTIPVADLTLDALNPRIPSNGSSPSQTALLHDLVENDRVYELAELIVVNGYLPDQYLIVAREKGKNVVIEGNRRLAACKLLLEPSLAPPDYVRRFSTLADRIDPASISELKTLTAPSREDAIPLIVSKHTDPAVEPWAPIMQANFYARQIKSGMTIEKLSKKIAVSASDIREALFTAGIYSEAKRLRLPTDIKETLNDPRAFKVSTLTRVADRPVGRQFLGLQQDAKGKLKITIAKPLFNKRLARIVNDIARGTKNSRNLNGDREIREYFAEIDGKAVAPAARATGLPARVPRTPAKPRVPKGLIPPEFPCESKNDRIREVVLELKRISVDDFPNATAVLLRVALELGAYQYLSDLKELTPWKRELAAAGRTDFSQFPSLTAMLKRMADKDLVDPALKRAINTFLGKKDPLVDEMNLYVHNGTYIPTATDLRNHWKKLSALLKLFFEKRG